MNQGKLEVVKQEMARVNVDILGISKLKWTGTGEPNSDDHHIYYCGQESLRRNGVAITVHKSPKSVLGCNLKHGRMVSIRFQSKPFNITISNYINIKYQLSVSYHTISISVIQIYAPTSNIKEAELNGSMKTCKTF